MYSDIVSSVIIDHDKETRTTVYKDGRRVVKSTSKKAASAPVSRKRGLSFTEMSINETIREIDSDISVLYRKMAALDVMMTRRVFRGLEIDEERREMGEYALKILQLKQLKREAIKLLG